MEKRCHIDGSGQTIVCDPSIFCAPGYHQSGQICVPDTPPPPTCEFKISYPPDHPEQVSVATINNCASIEIALAVLLTQLLQSH